MAIDTGALQSFSDSEMVLLLRSAIAHVTVGQAYSIGGRQLTRANLQELTTALQLFEANVAAAADGNGGNIALAEFGQEQ